jgi:hypothetical protein
MRNSKKHKRHLRLRRSKSRRCQPSLHSLHNQANRTVPSVQQASREPREEMLTRNIALYVSISAPDAHDKTPTQKMPPIECAHYSVTCPQM